MKSECKNLTVRPKADRRFRQVSDSEADHAIYTRYYTWSLSDWLTWRNLRSAFGLTVRFFGSQNSHTKTKSDSTSMFQT